MKNSQWYSLIGLCLYTVEELPVDTSYGSTFAPTDLILPRDPEKADMKIVESAAKDVRM